MSDVRDVVVVGGGITGLGVARLATRQGWSVTVVERGDLASGASGASSHMLHGGLRYLEHGRLGLVREALHERAVVSRMAPALARPVRFLVPVRRGDRVPPWKLRLGLVLYDTLARDRRFSPHGWLGAVSALAREPGLEPTGLRAAGRYVDVVMDDVGIALAVARDAAAHGAEVMTWTEVQGLAPCPGGTVMVRARDRLTGAEHTWETRVVVNATGAWSDAVRARLLSTLDPLARPPAPLLRPSRGVHLVYPPLTRSGGLLTLAGDGRVVFVVPLPTHALVGTTEIEVPSPPPEGAARPTLDEVRYLMHALARVLPDTRGARPLGVLTGLRPLLAGDGDVGGASREHGMRVEGPLITIAGGKYTTFRVMARDVVSAVARELGRAGQTLRDDLAPLAPAPSPEDPEALARVAVTETFARRLEDVLRRRSRLWLDPDPARAEAAARAMAQVLGWDASRTQAELACWNATRAEEQALLDRAMEEVIP